MCFIAILTLHEAIRLKLLGNCFIADSKMKLIDYSFLLITNNFFYADFKLFMKL